jgi:voltage-gated potassium channel
VALDAGVTQAIPQHWRFGSQDPRMIRSRRKNPTFMRAIYRTLDPSQRGTAADAFRLVHHTLVIAGIAAVILSTVPHIAEEHGWLLAAAFHLTLAFFAMEYVLRLYATPAAPWAHPGRPWRDRIQWALSFAGLVDLFSTWFMLLATVLPIEQDAAHLACMIWLFKLVPYSEGLSLLARVIDNTRSALLSVLLSFVIVLLCAGTLAYLLERDLQPVAFGSIPASLWWAVVTLTTTGYGDAVPITTLGRVLGGAVMIGGIAVFGLLAGILANGFAEEVRRRDLMRTWDLVTKVPFFNGVGAEAISEMTRLLRPREVQPGTTIMRRGEPGDCMYFVVSGEVEIRIHPKPLRLGAGAFFGEIALVTGEPRNATAVAAKFCVLLSLHLTDFRHLAARRPELTAIIKEEAERRLAQATTKKA